jgi:hypothetical protein
MRSFIVCTHRQDKKDEMGGICSTHSSGDKFNQNFSWQMRLSCERTTPKSILGPALVEQHAMQTYGGSGGAPPIVTLDIIPIG